MSALAPSSEQELAQIIAEHHASASPLSLQGGGTRGWQAQGARLSLADLSGVVDYQPGEMTLIARAGTPLAQIDSMLAAEGQCLAFEPMDLRLALGGQGSPTLGGILATNASGPRRLQVGACRDHLLGARFIDGRGRVIKSGGRVMKNVTGLDLARAMAGAHGTLGVLTEIAIKTLPILPDQLTLALPQLSLRQAQRVFATALSTPYEVSGAAYSRGTAYLRLEGLGPQLAWREQRLKALLADHARTLEVIGGTAGQALWQGLRDVSDFTDPAQPLWRILAAPRLGAALAERLQALGAEAALDWGGGLIWLQGATDAEAVRAIAPHATLIRPAGLQARRFPPQSAGVERLSAKLRLAFDPAGILNPGLMEG